MKNLSATMAIKIAIQYFDAGKIEDARDVLEFWEDLKIEDGVLLTRDESGSGFMPLGMDYVKNKIASGLSGKGIAEFLKEHNKAVKPEYVIKKFSPEIQNFIERNLDVYDEYPVFNYEIGSNETLSGAPFIVDLRGEEFFTWIEE